MFLLGIMSGDHLEGAGVYRRIILKWIFEKCVGGMDWIGVALERDSWRAVANAVVSLRVS